MKKGPLKCCLAYFRRGCACTCTHRHDMRCTFGVDRAPVVCPTEKCPGRQPHADPTEIDSLRMTFWSDSKKNGLAKKVSHGSCQTWLRPQRFVFFFKRKSASTYGGSKGEKERGSGGGSLSSAVDGLYAIGSTATSEGKKRISRSPKGGCDSRRCRCRWPPTWCCCNAAGRHSDSRPCIPWQRGRVPGPGPSTRARGGPDRTRNQSRIQC